MSYPIIRTECDVEYATPAGSSLLLPVNCAWNYDSEWAWYNFWSKTIGSGETTPVDSSGTEQNSSFFSYEGASEEGQVVIRGIFAYIATHPFSATINCSAKMNDDGGTGIDGGTAGEGDYEYPAVWSPNYELIATLYEPDGSEVENYFNISEETGGATITLPATVCPKVLRVGAKAQPSSDKTAFPYPTCSASLQVSCS